MGRDAGERGLSLSRGFSRIGKAVAVAIAALGLLMTPSSATMTGTVTISGGNTGITAGWRATPAGAEFLAKCFAGQATGQPVSLVNNGVGAFVIDLGAPKSGFVYTSATIAPTAFGPSIPTPDPTGLIFPSSSLQLHNYDLDLYFVSTQCSQVGQAVTQNSNEVGLITTPARYVVILLAFNATGGTAITVNYKTP